MRIIQHLFAPSLVGTGFYLAKLIVNWYENIRMIQKGQIIGYNDNASTFENFKMLLAA